MKPRRIFYYRGQIEVPSGKTRPTYRWLNGWSEGGETWRSKASIRLEAARDGFIAVFANRNTVCQRQTDTEETK